jgi:hypothetical protein
MKILYLLLLRINSHNTYVIAFSVYFSVFNLTFRLIYFEKNFHIFTTILIHKENIQFNIF